MKPLLRHDIPPRAAIAIVALVLLATVVTGREQLPEDAPAAPRRASLPPPAASSGLDLSKLARQREEASVEDLFAVPKPPVVLAPAPAPQKAEPPPAPVAPPLPYAYLGRMKKKDRTTLYLLRNQEMLIVEEGATLDGTYRVERISDTAAQFTYLPLGTAQVLGIPPAP